jgi:RecA/RadA recombinase
MSNKWLKQLQTDFSLDLEYDSFAPENIIKCGSPSINYSFANKSHGLPKDSSILLYAPAKAGKSLIAKSFVAELQRNNPEAITVEFNTEFRAMQSVSNIFNIDYERHQVYLTNRPSEIFDFCTKTLAALVQDGMPLGLIIIDSLTFIAGPKTLNADSVESHTIGDQAAVLTKGLQQIVPWLKRNRIPLIATAHMRANIDPSNPRAPKEKAAVNFMAKHVFEYFMSFRKAGAADDKVNLAGEEFLDKNQKDIRGNAEITGHKIISKMEESSLGTPGRTGMITLDYSRGIVNVHEELFTLGVNTKVIEKEGLRTYKFKDQKWSSKMDCANAIKDNTELAALLLEEVRKLDEK